MLGYYSDPPGIEMYKKILRQDGSVKKNKYGIEMIECMRGTNRTEAYHKNLLMTFGGWYTGVEMSACLLSERHHRHNHKCSELRRFGFPKIGHYDTWLVDQLQHLVMQNRDTRLFPNWSNVSEFWSTDESFDNIALHSQELHKTLLEQWEKNVDKSKVKLTSDQMYLCKAMEINLPFLPFATEEERKQFAKCVLDPGFPKKEEDAAIEWCKYVDGVTIFPKLPVHMRNYQEFERNERVRQSVENARDGNEKLLELNAALTSPPSGNMAREIPCPQAMFDPQPQAMRISPYVIVGGVAVGQTPTDVPRRMRGARGPDKRKRKERECRICASNGCKFFRVCSGRYPRGSCDFDNKHDGKPIPCELCVKFNGDDMDRETCQLWRDKKRTCEYFEEDGMPA